MTWLSFCARRPGPEWKTGYGTGDRTLAQIEGVVDHSAEGPLAAAMGVLDGSRQSSWTFFLPKQREPIQHYSLEKITWHAGLAGDRRQDTSLIGNLTLIGKEHEGVAGEPWTENQTYWSARIDVALRVLCPAFGANPPTLRLNQWEHRWLSATSCPSNRNLWEEKFALINEWETPTEEDEMKLYLINTTSDGTHYLTDWMTRWAVSKANLEELRRRKVFEGGSVDTIPEELMAAIPKGHGPGSGSYTDEQAVKAVKDKLT